MLTGTIVLKVLMVILSCWHVDRHHSFEGFDGDIKLLAC
jgi:hypothetical protein